MLSQCLHRSWHFQYKIFTLPLVILIIIAFVVTICYYGFEYSEHIKNGIRVKLLSAPFHIDTRGGNENVKYDKCWHLHFKCHPFLKRVWRDRLSRYSNTEEMNSSSHLDEADSYIITRQSAVKVSQRGKRNITRYVKHSAMFTIVSQSEKIGKR